MAAAANLSDAMRTAVGHPLIGLRSQPGAREIDLHRGLKRWRANLDFLAGTPAPFQGKPERRLSCGVRRNNWEPSDQNTPGLTANVFLKIPGLGLLPDEENETPDLAVPVLVWSPAFVCGNLARERLCELWHFVGFLSVTA